MLKGSLSFAVLALFALGSRQDMDSPARVAFERAQAAFAREHVEDGVLALREARATLSSVRDSALRADLGEKIETQLSKKDPVAKFYDEAVREAASSLSAAARAYQAKQWHATALTYVHRASALDSSLPPDWILELERKTQPSSLDGSASAFDRWFQQGVELGRTPAFNVGDQCLQANFTKTVSEMQIFLGSQRARSGNLSFAVDVSPQRAGVFGLVFGYHGPANFQVVRVNWEQSEWRLAVATFVEDRFTTHAEVVGKHEDLVVAGTPGTTAGQAPTLRLSLTAQASSVRAALGPVRLEASLPELPKDGVLGVFAAAEADGFGVKFERFQVRASAHVPRIALQASAPADSATEARIEEPALRERLAKAAADCDAGQAEAGAQQLRELRQDVLALAEGAKRHKLLGELSALHKRVDALEEPTRKSLDHAARGLLDQAQSYARRKWPRAALAPLEIADGLSTEIAGRKLAQGRLAAASQPRSTRTVTQEWFGTGVKFLDFGQWKVEQDAVQSPPLGGVSVGYASSKSTGVNYLAGIEIALPSCPSRAAFVFGLKPTNQDYYVLELVHELEYSAVRVQHYVSSQNTFDGILAKRFHMTAAERAGFVDLVVEVRTNQIRIAVGELLEAHVEAPTVDLSGRLGMFVSGNSPGKDPVVFRNLRVE